MDIAGRLRDQLNLATKLSVQRSPLEAWDQVVRDTKAGDIICIAGSAYLAAELRPKILTVAR